MYLSGEGVNFGFKHPKLNKIEVEDVEISDDIYKRFFKEQEQGKELKIRNKNGETFEAIFEEVM